MASKKARGEQFKEVVDFAFSESEHAHARIKESLSLYKNEGYDDEKWILGLPLPTKKSIDPKIRRAINRLIPAYTEQTLRIEVQPDKTDYLELDIEPIDELMHWNEMMESLDNEAERMETMVSQNLTCGTAISTSYYDRAAGVVRTYCVDPLNFAPDPATTTTNFANSQYLAHRSYETTNFIKRRYPDFQTEGGISRWWRAKQVEWGWKDGLPIDRLWMRPQFAKDLGCVIDDSVNMVVATLIDGELARLIQNPTLYPDFPYTGWSNFIDIEAGKGKAKGFWGTSNADNMKDQQKLLDEALSSYFMMARNAKTGRWLGLHGAFDDETFYNSHGAFLELPDGMPLDAVREIQAAEPPVSLANLIPILQKMVDDDAVSLNPTFVGEAPFGGASGRLATILQTASFNQITNNIRRFNEARTRMLRIRLNFIQQFARVPKGKLRWRAGIDLPTNLSKAARNVGFNLAVPNVSSLQATPAGKIQILSLLAEFGIFLSPAKVIEMLGLDTGFSITTDDIIVDPNIAAERSQRGTTPVQGTTDTEAAFL